jgi:uncharacterized protein with FMN-binding domain
MRNKLVLSLGLIVASAIYATWQHLSSSAVLQTATTGQTPSQEFKSANDALLQTLSQITVATVTPATQSATMGGSMMNGPMMRGQYRDGSYTGNPADAYYGTVQVKAIVRGGRIADVVFLDHPHTHENSIFINNQAMPLLTQEAIQAQSAQVDGVSGATFTSDAFKQSLASALALAKN